MISPNQGVKGGTRPRVAILVLNWNGWRDTVECLESLFRLDYEPMTVVLCDNGSTDGSVDRILEWAGGAAVETREVPSRLRALSEPPVPKPIRVERMRAREADAGQVPGAGARMVLIENDHNAGFAGGTNVGLRYLYAARGHYDYVWILNNDIVVAPDSLSQLVGAMERNPGLGAVGPTLFEYATPEVVQVAGGGEFRPWRGFPRPRTKLPEVHGDTVPLGYVGGGCMLARVRVLAEVGLIDERYFMYGEDVDFSLRITGAALRLAHVPAARAWHKGGATTGYSSPKHDYYVVRNNLYLMKKYAPGLVALGYAFALVQFILPKMARRQRRRLAAVVQAYSDYRRGVFGPLPSSSDILRQ